MTKQNASKVPASVAKAATDKANPSFEDNRKTVDEAAKDKEPPVTTEQPKSEPVERDENPIGLPPMPAHLEGQEDVKTPVKLELMPAYEQGRAAFRSGIGKDDAPYGDGTARDAWVKGWNFSKKSAA